MKAAEEPAAPDGFRETPWFLYVLKCGDGSFYTGVTNDVERRLKAHQDGKASRYTRTRRPVELVYSEECGNRPLALARECAVKALPRERKEALVSGRGRPGLPSARRRQKRTPPGQDPNLK